VMMDENEGRQDLVALLDSEADWDSEFKFDNKILQESEFRFDCEKW
jgi:hypothetical protein